VLREVFDLPYGEIAEAVDKSAAAVRQIGHRAREHVSARRPRMEVSRTEQQQVVERFLAAVTQGDLQGLLDVLAPDVVVLADGGGRKQPAPRPVVGAEKVARMFFGGLGKVEQTLTTEHTVVNGNPAMVLRLDDELDGVITFRVEDGRIAGIYYVRNPEKLTRVESETSLTLR